MHIQVRRGDRTWSPREDRRRHWKDKAQSWTRQESEATPRELIAALEETGEGSSQARLALVLGREESIDGLGDERLGSPLDHHHSKTDVRLAQTYQRERFCLGAEIHYLPLHIKHQGRISR